MHYQIKLDRHAEHVVANRRIFDQLLRNEASHFLAGNLRQDIFKVKSYLSNSARTDDFLYLNVNLVNLVATAFADFAVGGGVKIKIADPELQTVWDDIAEENNFGELIYQSMINQSVIGYSVLRTRLENENVVLEEIPHEYYYPNVDELLLGQKPDTHHIVSLREGKKGEVSAIIQTYQKMRAEDLDEETYTQLGPIKNEIGWLYTRGTYLRTEHNFVLEGDLTAEWLDFLPLTQVNNQCISGEYFGESDFAPVLDLLEEFNDRITQISVQFIKHLNSKLALPESMGNALLNEEKSINEVEFFGYRAGENPPEYVENKNSLIPEAQEYLDRLLRMISAIVQIPTSFLGLQESGGAEKVEALKIKLNRFLKKVQRKQKMHEIKIKKLVRDSLRLAGHADCASIEVIWSDPLPQDLATDASVYSDLADDGIITRRTALTKIMKDWDEGRINQEETDLE